MILPEENAREAAVVEGIEVYPVAHRCRRRCRF